MPLGSLLISIALSSNARSNVAVLQSLLALASLYRYGCQMQAVQLKVAALQSLRASTVSTGKDISVVEAVKHVAAGMLLCTFEVRYHDTLESRPTSNVEYVLKPPRRSNSSGTLQAIGSGMFAVPRKL